MSALLKGFLEGVLGTEQVNALEQVGHLSSRLLFAVIVAVITLILATRAREGIQYFFKQRKGDYGLAVLLGRLAYFSILFVGVLVVLRVFGVPPTALVATFGVAGLAVSLAMQDVLKNVFAGVYLLVERPFRLGETIQVRTFTGVVETIELRTTTLRAEGELIYVPNAILFAEILINRGLIRVVKVDSVPDLTRPATIEEIAAQLDLKLVGNGKPSVDGTSAGDGAASIKPQK